MIRVSCFLCFVLCLVSGFVPCSVHADLRAGVAKVDITPDVVAWKVPLGGYAARKGRPATGVLSPVFARAVILQEGKTKVAIVSCDLCFLPAGVRNAVTELLKTTSAADAHLFLAATHTHTAPDPLAMHPGNMFRDLKGWTSFDERLLQFTAGKIAEAIVRADATLRPVEIETASATLKNRNRNRRGDPTVDSQMTVVRLVTKSSLPSANSSANLSTHSPNAPQPQTVLATLINFAAHPTLFDDTDMEISPDYPGVLASETEKRTGEGSVCLFLNGAEGDATVSGATGKTALERVQFYGKTLAEEAKAIKSTATETRASKAQESLLFREIEVTLPPRKPHGTFIVAAASLGATFAQARALVNTLMPLKTTLTCIGIGDLLLIGFPCEPTGDIGLAAKSLAKKAGYKNPCVVALVNDWLGYCLTPEQYRAGKYEATMSFFGETIGTTLLAGLEKGLMSK